MSNNIYSEWDNSIDCEGLAKDLIDIESNSLTKSDYDDVPTGKYIVEISKLELAPTKKDNKPQLVVWFKIVEGNQHNRLLFAYYGLTTGYGLHNANEFLKSLDTPTEVKWTGKYSDYANMIKQIFEDTKKSEYELDYTLNTKGYKVYKIEEVYDK